MMHNSLLIADRLLETNNSVMHKSRRDPHKFIRKLNTNDLHDDEIELGGVWSVQIASALPGMKEAAADVLDYLQKAGLAINPNATENFIHLKEDASVSPGSFQRTVDRHAIVISASDTRGIWAGIVYLERELSLRGSAVLKKGTIVRSPAWQTQISQAPYGANYLVPDLNESYLSDDAFRLLIHYGATGMTIYGDWMLYVKSDIFPELNCTEYERNISMLKDAAERAKKYGISLYYVPVSPKLDENHPLFARVLAAKGARISPGLKPDAKRIHNLCSSDPLSLAFHGETMANLFREVPDLGGLILIIGGESYYHCFMRPDKTGLKPGAGTNCPRCAGKKPEDVVNSFLKATTDAVQRQKPGAPVMAWPYSAFVWSSDAAQLEMLRGMDPGVSLLSTIDKDEWVGKDGYQKLIWDYSVDYTGPASNLLKQAEILRSRNMDLYVKTETAIGLECIHVPYVPSIRRHAEKWRNVAGMKPKGVLQSWMFFGMWGSRAEETGWWAAWHPETDSDEMLKAIAERDFGEAYSAIIRAWSDMSEAVSHLPYIPIYFTGPEFVGPAHPLFFDEDVKKREAFEALLYYLQENEETFSTTVNEVKHLLALEAIPYAHIRHSMKTDKHRDEWEVFIGESERALFFAKQAFSSVSDCPRLKDPLHRKQITEEMQTIEYIYRTFLTSYHTYRFLKEKESGDLAAMREIARWELDNAKQAKRLYIEAPWFDLSHRTDGNYPSSFNMLEAKIELLEQSLGADEASF